MVSAWVLVTLASLAALALRLRRLPARPPAAAERGDERSHRAAGARHRRRPQRPGGLRGAALGAAAAGRVARRGVRPPAPAGDHRFGQWIRFSHDGRGFLAYESRTWRLTDDGADRRPRRRASPASGGPAARTTSSCWSPARTGWWRSTSARARTTTSWELATDVLARTPDAPDVTRAVRLYGIVDGALHVRDRPGRPATSRCAHHVRPTRTDPMTTARRQPPPRHPAPGRRRLRRRRLRPRPDRRHLAGHPPRRRPAARPQPGRAGGRGGADRGARSPSWTGCSPTTRRWTTTRSSGAAPGCCASGSAPSWPLHEAGEGLRALSNLFSPVHSIRQVFCLMPTAHRGGLGRHRPPAWRGCPRPTAGFRETLEEGAAPRAARRPAPGATPSSRQLDEWLAGPYFAGVRRRAAPRRCAPSSTRPPRRGRRGGRRDPRLPARRLRGRRPRGRRTPSAGSATPAPPAAGPAPTSAPGSGLEEAYAWGWAEHRRILAEQRVEAEKVLPGRAPRWRPCAGWAATARRSRAWRRSATGCRR